MDRFLLSDSGGGCLLVRICSAHDFKYLHICRFVRDPIDVKPPKVTHPNNRLCHHCTAKNKIQARMKIHPRRSKVQSHPLSGFGQNHKKIINDLVVTSHNN